MLALHCSAIVLRMNIGEPKRKVTIEPIREPIPRERTRRRTAPAPPPKKVPARV
jgi:hypothetical protein